MNFFIYPLTIVYIRFWTQSLDNTAVNAIVLSDALFGVAQKTVQWFRNKKNCNLIF